MMVSIKLKNILFLGYLYLLIPFIVFVLGWIKLIFAIPIVILCGIIIFLMYRESQEYIETISISKKTFFSIILILAVWIMVLGSIGIFPQSIDMLGRNAMFKDLIEFQWPVVYPQNGLVTYYHGIWLVPALLGKVLGYTLAQVALFIWLLLGLVFTILLLFNYLKISNTEKQLITLVIFMFFSGIIWSIGAPYLPTEFMSHSYQIYYLQNQSIPVWLFGLLFLLQKNSRQFAFFGVIILFSPYAIISILPFIIVRVIQYMQKLSFVGELKNILSPINILSTVAIAPILIVYFSSNSTTTDGFTYVLIFISNIHQWLFICLQSTLIYLVITFPLFKKDPIFWVTAGSILVFSTIKYSIDHNFSRTLNLAIFYTFIYVIKFMWSEHNLFQLRKKILFVLLGFSLVNGGDLFMSHIRHFIFNGYSPMQFADYRDAHYNRQWSNKDYKTTPFYKYLIRK